MNKEKITLKILEFLNEKHFSGQPMHYFMVDEVIEGAKLKKVKKDIITGILLYLTNKEYTKGIRQIGVPHPIGIYITEKGIDYFENLKIKSPQKNNNDNSHVSKKLNNLFKGKFNRVIIVGIIIWFIFGISMSFLAIDGYFLKENVQPVSVSKEYLISVETSNETEGIHAKASGLKGFMTLKGTIDLTSTLFSAQNEIKINSKLFPDDSFEGYEDRVIETLPEPFWIIIPDAKNIINDKIIERDFAIINLTKSYDPPSIVGNGTIIFTKGGNNEIFLIDPQELDKINGLFDTGKNITFTYQLGKALPVGSNVTNVAYFEEDGSTYIDYVEFSILTSENISYFVEIKTADSLGTLESSKETSLGIWLAVTFGPIGLGMAFLFRKH